MLCSFLDVPFNHLLVLKVEVSPYMKLKLSNVLVVAGCHSLISNKRCTYTLLEKWQAKSRVKYSNVKWSVHRLVWAVRHKCSWLPNDQYHGTNHNRKKVGWWKGRSSLSAKHRTHILSDIKMSVVTHDFPRSWWSADHKSDCFILARRKNAGVQQNARISVQTVFKNREWSCDRLSPHLSEW